MSSRKSQSSLELVMISAISLFVLMISSLMLFNYTNNSVKSLVISQVDDIGRSMAANAEVISNYGPPARKVIEYNFPDHIEEITILDDHTIFVNVGGFGEDSYFGFYSEAKLSIPTILSPEDLAPGKKRFIFESVDDIEDVVEIRRWKR